MTKPDYTDNSPTAPIVPKWMKIARRNGAVKPIFMLNEKKPLRGHYATDDTQINPQYPLSIDYR